MQEVLTQESVTLIRLPLVLGKDEKEIREVGSEYNVHKYRD